MVITSSGVWRASKTLVLKTIVDDALQLAADNGHRVPTLSPVPCSMCWGHRR